MGQFGFFDANDRLEALSAKGDPLEAIDALVPWESFRKAIEAVVLTPVAEKKNNAGRKPIDAMVMFRMLILQSLYNLSDDQAEYQVRDRLSFTRFLKLGIEDAIPDGTTLWLFRETLAKAGKTPPAWKKDPSKNRQKDKDARWTKKHGKSFFGYKNHVNADARHKLIRDYDVTDASVHDSQKLDGLLNNANTSQDVYADSAYRSAETEAKLNARGFRSRIHSRASRNHRLSDAQVEANRKKSKVRVRIEHVFGAQENAPGGRIIRTIGAVRARAKIGLQNLVYNLRRLVILERMATA